mgnify:CR=1 FL=1
MPSSATEVRKIFPSQTIGDDAAGYVSLITGPRRPDETDGPEELHLVIVDGGRSALRETPAVARRRMPWMSMASSTSGLPPK